jgi:hypothetical protein
MGIRAGDVIVAIDGNALRNPSQFWLAQRTRPANGSSGPSSAKTGSFSSP